MSDERKLTVTQVTAIAAVNGALRVAQTELAQARAKTDQAMAKWKAVMEECGLDTNKNWNINADGTYQEQVNARKVMTAQPAEKPADAKPE